MPGPGIYGSPQRGHLYPNWSLGARYRGSSTLVHFITADLWGHPPPLFFEGTAIHLSDRNLFANVFGDSYHQWVAAMLESGEIDLLRLVPFDEYFHCRSDFRVDMLAASFVGFLIEAHGIGALKVFFKTFIAPSSNLPTIDLRRPLAHAYQQTFAALEQSWRAFLAKQMRSEKAMKHLAKYVPPARQDEPRCRYCGTVVRADATDCSECHSIRTGGQIVQIDI